MSFNKSEYQQLLIWANEDDVHIQHDLVNRHTIAWSRTVSNRNSTMIDLAISHCSPAEPSFIKKVGVYHALKNFYDNQTIRLPLGSTNIAIISENIRDMFSIKSYRTMKWGW